MYRHDHNDSTNDVADSVEHFIKSQLICTIKTVLNYYCCYCYCYCYYYYYKCHGLECCHHIVAGHFTKI